MKRIKNGHLLTITMAGTLALTGCGGSGGPDSAATEGSTGIFNLSVSDSPIKDAEKVCIKFDGVQLKKSDDSPPFDLDFDFDDDPETVDSVFIDLLDNQGAISETLISAEVEAGDYEWIRLKVDAERGSNAGGDDEGPEAGCNPEEQGSYLTTESGATYNIWIPSGDKTGLKLVNGFTVPVNASASYTAEWDLGMSFKAPPGQQPAPGLNPEIGEALMRPTVKLVGNNEVGTLNGTVAAAFFVAQEGEDAALCPADSEFAPMIYVFDEDGNSEIAIDRTIDADGTEVDRDPVASALVAQDMDDAEMPYVYEVGFLLAGDYEVAFTCDDQVTYIPANGKAAPIAIGEITTVDITTDDLPAAE